MKLSEWKLYSIYALGHILQGSPEADEKYLKILFKYLMGKECNFDNPQTYSEKLQWLKIYDRNPLYTQSFFDGLSDIDTVIVIGHSLSEVDMEYFEKICSEIHSDAKWIFSCHDSAGLKAISALVKTMAIGADRVTIFRL